MLANAILKDLSTADDKYEFHDETTIIGPPPSPEPRHGKKANRKRSEAKREHPMPAIACDLFKGTLDF